MRKIVRRVGIAVSAVALAAGLGLAVATPASAASNCQTQSVVPTAGGYLATISCSETIHYWSFSTDGSTASGSWGDSLQWKTFKGVGNTPTDAASNAAWIAYNSTSSVYCTDVQTWPVAGGYNVVYTCPGGYMPFPNASGPDLNTAVSWTNYMWVLYR
ncbi:hypothetical protein ACPPVW_18425 [Leifsonia sp. McL0607]|uniref:hypothetical protein n=1 Tax=Leifsonia sp. McL0607 TaxID=3415672 RepID=UPI003CE7F04B